MAIIDTKNSSITPTRDMTSLTGTPQASSDPYSVFSNNIGSMLTTLQKTNTAGNAALGGAANTLTNESITGNAAKFDPTVMSDSQVGNQQNLQNAFVPAISSINTQIAGNNATLAGINTFANTALGQMKGQYSYQFNPNTNSFDSYNQNTGTWMNDGGTAAKKSGVNTSETNNKTNTTLVNGANFASYNPTDPDYSTKIQGMVTSIQKQMPNGFDPVVADTILTQHKSPITSHMIDAVSTSTGVDPVNIMAQLGLESGYGTSNVASEDNNPLGVTWVAGMSNAVQGTPRPANEGGFYAKFKSMQDGLYSGTKILADKTSQTNTSQTNNQTTTQTLTDPTGNSFYNPKYNSRVQNAISTSGALTPYIKAGPGGVAYIDKDSASSVDIRMGQAAQALGSKYGIPVADSNDISVIDGINNISQYVQSMKGFVDKYLNTGSSPTASALQNTISSKVNDVLKNNPNLDEFNSFVGGITNTISTIKDIAGGAGSGVRITGAEIAGLNSDIPQTTDSYQTAIAKIKSLNTKISQIMHTAFPDFDVNQVVTPQSQTTPQNNLPKNGDKKTYQGANYTFDGTQWTQDTGSSTSIPTLPQANNTGAKSNSLSGLGYTPPSWMNNL